MGLMYYSKSETLRRSEIRILFTFRFIITLKILINQVEETKWIAMALKEFWEMKKKWR
jgi:hypothetical protein